MVKPSQSWSKLVKPKVFSPAAGFLQEALYQIVMIFGENECAICDFRLPIWGKAALKSPQSKRFARPTVALQGKRESGLNNTIQIGQGNRFRGLC
jgi:hypothetical protein